MAVQTWDAALAGYAARVAQRAAELTERTTMQRHRTIRRQLVVPVGATSSLSLSTRLGVVASRQAQRLRGRWHGQHRKMGRSVEIGPDGDEASWGTTLRPGDARPHPADVAPRLLFRACHRVGSALRRGRRRPDPRDARAPRSRSWRGPTAVQAEYRTGSVGVLTRYADLTSDTAEPSAANEADEVEVWLVLLHTPGMAIGAAKQHSTHPDFPEHLAFLRRLRDEGLLVAAGRRGANQVLTVVRLPDAERRPRVDATRPGGRPEHPQRSPRRPHPTLARIPNRLCRLTGRHGIL